MTKRKTVADAVAAVHEKMAQYSIFSLDLSSIVDLDFYSEIDDKTYSEIFETLIRDAFNDAGWNFHNEK